MSNQEKNALHLKYRPTTFSKMIGHEAAVTRMRGMVASGKMPNALLITGPSGAGKTTFARAIHHEINGLTDKLGYMDINAGADSKIEDIRQLIQTSKFKPSGKKRIICIDEAQMLLANKASTNAILKPLEEPAPDTMWILCSMDPGKFKIGDGVAVARRCTQIILEPHTQSDLLKFAKRIAKGENMHYVLDEDGKLLKTIIRASNGDMSTLANVMQSTQQYYDGLEGKKPKLLKKDQISSVLNSIVSSDETLAVTILTAIYCRKFADVQMALLDVSDPFQIMQKMTWANGYVMNKTILGNTRHPKVWPSTAGTTLMTNVSKIDGGVSLGTFAAVNEALVNLRAAIMATGVEVPALMSARFYRLIKDLSSK